MILGGADNASFCWISSIDDEKVNYRGGQFYKDEIILEVQGEKVAGYTLQDLLDWLWAVSDNGNPVLFKTVSSSELILCSLFNDFIFLEVCCYRKNMKSLRKLQND